MASNLLTLNYSLAMFIRWGPDSSAEWASIWWMLILQDSTLCCSEIESKLYQEPSCFIQTSSPLLLSHLDQQVIRNIDIYYPAAEVQSISIMLFIHPRQWNQQPAEIFLCPSNHQLFKFRVKTTNLPNSCSVLLKFSCLLYQ